MYSTHAYECKYECTPNGSRTGAVRCRTTVLRPQAPRNHQEKGQGVPQITIPRSRGVPLSCQAALPCPCVHLLHPRALTLTPLGIISATVSMPIVQTNAVAWLTGACMYARSRIRGNAQSSLQEDWPTWCTAARQPKNHLSTHSQPVYVLIVQPCANTAELVQISVNGEHWGAVLPPAGGDRAAHRCTGHVLNEPCPAIERN